MTGALWGRCMKGWHRRSIQHTSVHQPCGWTGSINRSAPWLRCRYIIRERLHSHTCPVNLSVGRMRNTVTLGLTEGGRVLHLMHGANTKADIRHSSANVSRTTWATVKGLTWKLAIRLKIRPSYSTSIPWYIWIFHTALVHSCTILLCCFDGEIWMIQMIQREIEIWVQQGSTSWVTSYYWPTDKL